jgi:enoyl-CoA hydratase/carnithine racemase
MSEPEVVLERHPRGDLAFAEVRLNRPHRGNALTLPMLDRLEEIVGEIAGDGDVRAVVLKGAGRFFCTGGDIEAWGSLSPREMERHWIPRGIEVFERLAALPQPVIAALAGHALGGGLELALAADLRIAVRTAKLGCPEATLGMVPGWAGTRRLAELIGPARARHLLLLGSPIPAAQALEWGLVTAVAEDEADLEAQLDAWLDRLLANGPSALALVKGLLGTLHADMRREHARAVAQAADTEDCREGVRAFLEKRRPVYRGR